MSDSVKKVNYCYRMVPNRPGQGATFRVLIPRGDGVGPAPTADL